MDSNRLLPIEALTDERLVNYCHGSQLKAADMRLLLPTVLSIAALCAGASAAESQHTITEGAYFGFWGGTGQAVDFSVRSAGRDQWIATCENVPSEWVEHSPGPGTIRITQAPDSTFEFEILEGPTHTPPQSAKAFILPTSHGPALTAIYTDVKDDRPKPVTRPIGVFLDRDLTAHPSRPRSIITIPVVDGPDFEVRYWTTKEGLPHDNVRAIAMGPDKRLWFGTINGLVRFDGAHFEVHTPSNTNGALPDANISRLLTLPDGRLAIGTKGSGLFFYSNGRFTPSVDNSILSELWITKLVQTKDSTLWLLGEHTDKHTELFGVDPNSGQIKHHLHASDVIPFDASPYGYPTHIRDVYAADGETVYFGLAHFGLLSFDLIKRESTTILSGAARHPLEPFPMDERLLNLEVGMGFTDSEFTSLDIRLPHDPKYRPVRYTRAYRSEHSGDWVPAENAILNIHHDSWRKFDLGPDGPGSSIRGFADDYQGTLWFYTQDRGIGRLRVPVIQAIETPIQEQDLKEIQFAGTYGGKLFVGEKKNLYIRDQLGHWDTTTFDIPEDPRPDFSQHISSMAITDDDEHELILGLSGPRVNVRIPDVNYPPLAIYADGVISYCPLPNTFPQVRHVHSVAWSREHGVFLATHEGILQFSNNQWKLHDLLKGGDEESAYHVYRDPLMDRVWVGFYYGDIGYFDDGFHHISAPFLRSAETGILCFFRDSSETLWVGTMDGLCIIEGDTVRKVALEGSPENINVNFVLEDRLENLWFGTNVGIFCLTDQQRERASKSPNETVHALRFTENDGLPQLGLRSTWGPSGCLLDDGRIVAVTESRGLVTWDPKAAIRSTRPSLVELNSVETSAKTPGEVQELAFKSDADANHVLAHWASRLLNFEFSAVEFDNYEDVTYKYRLRGLTDEWKDSGGRTSVTYPGLESGDYVFEVNAVNDNLAVSEKTASLAFTVRPHILETVWFRALAVTILLIGATLTHRRILGARTKMQNLRAESALIHERTRISRDMHDHIGNTLAQIQMICKATRGKDYPRVLADHGLDEKLVELSDNASHSLRSIVWSLNPEERDFDDFSKFVRKLAESAVEHTSIRLSFEAKGSLENGFSAEQKHELSMILRGILSNVIKHSEAKRLSVALEALGDRLELRILDDGIGFNQEQSSGNGIGFIHLRVEKLGGNVALETSPGNGTFYHISIPK